MPRAYEDVVADFRGGMGAAYARGGNYRAAENAVIGYDPQAAAAYAVRGEQQRVRRREDEDTAYARDYASRYAANDYAGAEQVAASRGDLSGLTAARTGRQQYDERQRLELYRGAQQSLSELEAIDAQQGQGYEEYYQRARQAVEQNPGMDPALRELALSLPEQWNPRVSGAVRQRVIAFRDSLLSPDAQARAEREQQRIGLEEERVRIAEERASLAEQRAGDGGATQAQIFQRANSLRDEFNTQTAGFRTIADFAARSEEYMARIARNPRAASGQADIGLVYALAKIYDPTSVVREGEFATVARQGGYGEQMRSWITQAQGGGFSSAIRNQIMTEIRSALTAAQRQRDQISDRYTQQAQRWGIDPADVVGPYGVTTAQQQYPEPSREAMADLLFHSDAESRRQFDEVYGPGKAAEVLDRNGAR